MIKKCSICGKDFKTYRSFQKTCSPECGRILSNRRALGWYRKNKQKLAIKKCVVCGKEFEPNHGNQITCSPECRCQRYTIKAQIVKSKQNKLKTAQYLERWRTKKLMKNSKCKTLKCPECGGTFYGYSKFCSFNCELKHLARIDYSKKTFEWLKGMTLHKWKNLSHRKS